MSRYQRKPSIGQAMTGRHRFHPRYQGCVGHWMFVEGGGNVLHDVSGFGYDGTMQNMDVSTDWVIGPRGFSLEFDGSNDRVDVNHIYDMDRMTILWTSKCFIGSPNAEGIFSLRRAAGDLYRVWSYHWSRAGINGMSMTLLHGGTQINRMSSISFVQGEWHGFATRLDGINSTMDIYIDGIEATGASFSGVSIPSTNRLELGRAHDAFPGNIAIDDFRMYNRLLSDDEIRSIYHYPYLEFYDIQLPVKGTVLDLGSGVALSYPIYHRRRRL